MQQVAALGDNLEFVVGGERIELALGAAHARRWAVAIAAPPPTLTGKLGITAATRLHRSGPIDDDALRDALAGAVRVEFSACDLALVRTDDAEILASWVAAVAAGTHTRSPGLGEFGVREVMRRFGFIDTKIAAVSGSLGALRFVKQR